MRSYATSYNNLFARRMPDAPLVERIEIPIFQRDYAQGRESLTVKRIRASFLDVLHKAVTGGGPVNLDFVYGDVENDGTFRPLDGQQRLTTLFLLHWYLAFRAERMSQVHGWKNFSYAIRLSARRFCERLTDSPPPPSSEEKLSTWIRNQAWYLYTWDYDPTIQSMLVMLDAMHARFRDDDCVAAWQLLVEAEEPGVTFDLLPMEHELMGTSEGLYINMNSRGKPLTRYEDFKARLEQVLEISYPDRVAEFACKIDGKWSDLLWPYRGSDSTVDDEFLRYFHFLTEVCEWQEGRLAEEEIFSLSESVYGQKPKGADNLDFVFRAFDAWEGIDIEAIFSELFTAASPPINSDKTSKVVLFDVQGDADVNLFVACCKNYGQMRWPRNRVFSLSHTIFLYAVLLHRIHQTDDFARRLRVVRNLVEASTLRLEDMPALMADVRYIVREGTLESVRTFNQTQVADEKLKAEVLAKCPDLTRSLFHLEDHPVLRGCLTAFELDETVFERRASAFHQLFADRAHLPSLTGALLAIGDYSRRLQDNRRFQLGSGSNLRPWRELLTGGRGSHPAVMREVLGRLLDTVSQAEGSTQSVLDTIRKSSLDAAIDRDGLDWRWYFVKYPVMREGNSGIYVGSNGELGYSVCMLEKTQMNSYYRDPYLSACYRESKVESPVEEPWFTGYETNPRWMYLKSGTGLQFVKEGLVLRPPPAPAYAEAFSQVCAKHGVREDHVLPMPQVERNGYRLDTRDRVQLGAALLRDLVMAGL